MALPLHEQPRRLLRAVAGAPDDRIQRLVCADCLQDHGLDLAECHRRVLAEPGEDVWRWAWASLAEQGGQEDRAEFVRVQLQLGDALRRRKQGSWVDAQVALLVRETTLWLNHPAEWTHGWPGILGDATNDLNWWWCGGFVENVTCNADDWLADGDRARQAQPIRRVRLTASDAVYIWRNHNDSAAYLSLEDGKKLTGEYPIPNRGFWNDALAVIRAESPGIEFALPSG